MPFGPLLLVGCQAAQTAQAAKGAAKTCQSAICYADEPYSEVTPFESVDLREEGLFFERQYPGGSSGAGPAWAETLAQLEMVYALRAKDFSSTPKFWRGASGWTKGVSSEYIL